MLAWSFAARTADEVGRLLRAACKHRYLREADLRLHWTVDAALAELPELGEHARRFEERRRREPELEIDSRDPSLWRPATIDEIVTVLNAFWTPGDTAERYKARLLEAIASTGLPSAEHEPFGCPPDAPPHPELVLLDWVLLPVDQLDSERHTGALHSMGASGEEVKNPSDPIYQEGPILAAPELCEGATNGVLADDFVLWSEEPYYYADYVFRGLAKSAKLVDEPVGYRDL